MLMKKLLICALFILIFSAFVFVRRAAIADIHILSPRQAKNIIPSQKNITYTDGKYRGEVADAYWGDVQVEAEIRGGKIQDIVIIEYPAARLTSDRINGEALPQLISEAIQIQDVAVDIISGATNSSLAFKQSLSSALAHAQ